MAALVVGAALLLAFGIAMRARDGGASQDELRIVPGAAAVFTATATPTIPPTRTASPTATLTPSATPTAEGTALPAPPTATAGVPPTVGSSLPATGTAITLQPSSVGVGQTMLVRVRADGADSGSLTFRGESLPLSLDGDQLWAVVGVPVTAAVGPATLTVSTRDPAGVALATIEATYEVVPVERPVQNLTLTTEEASVLTPEAGQKEYALRLQQFARFDRGRRWNGRFVRPLSGPITTYFGEGRRINGGPAGAFHSGADIANALGTPVVAAAEGRVSWAGEMPIRGNTVIIDHGSGVLTHYSHLSQIDVTVDQVVRPGESIGLVGSTGLSTGPHLHWELSIYGVNVDPFEWISTDFTPGPSPAARTPAGPAN